MGLCLLRSTPSPRRPGLQSDAARQSPHALDRCHPQPPMRCHKRLDRPGETDVTCYPIVDQRRALVQRFLASIQLGCSFPFAASVRTSSPQRSAPVPSDRDTCPAGRYQQDPAAPGYGSLLGFAMAIAVELGLPLRVASRPDLVVPVCASQSLIPCVAERTHTGQQGARSAPRAGVGIRQAVCARSVPHIESTFR